MTQHILHKTSGRRTHPPRRENGGRPLRPLRKAPRWLPLRPQRLAPPVAQQQAVSVAQLSGTSLTSRMLKKRRERTTNMRSPRRQELPVTQPSRPPPLQLRKKTASGIPDTTGKSGIKVVGSVKEAAAGIPTGTNQTGTTIVGRERPDTGLDKIIGHDLTPAPGAKGVSRPTGTGRAKTSSNRQALGPGPRIGLKVPGEARGARIRTSNLPASLGVGRGHPAVAHADLRG